MIKQNVLAVVISFTLGVVIVGMNACAEFTATNNFSSVGNIDNQASAFAKTQQVLQADCLNCHRAGGSSSSFEFTTPQQFISAGLIVPGRPRQSKLITRMINFNDPAVTTDNMPLASSAISNADYMAIYNWIADMPSDQSPFECTDDTFRVSDVDPTNAKRLSIRQYTNTLKDLITLGATRTVANTIVDGALASFELPTDTGQVFKRENNSFLGGHAQSFFDIADRVALQISTNNLTTFVNQFISLSPGSCASPNPTSLSTVCRDRLITNFASRAFRRPLRDPAQNLTTAIFFYKKQIPI
jgi:mono/diheme cytochrome c family protein